MAIIIHKILSKSTGEESSEPNFWFKKSSYGKYIVDCRFGDDLLKTSIITSADVFVLDKDGDDVTSTIWASTVIVEDNDSVLIGLQAGSVSGSPYDVYCRIQTDNEEQSELEFQMIITRDSISSSLGEPFEELDETFEELDETF